VFRNSNSTLYPFARPSTATKLTTAIAPATVHEAVHEQIYCPQLVKWGLSKYYWQKGLKRDSKGTQKGSKRDPKVTENGVVVCHIREGAPGTMLNLKKGASETVLTQQKVPVRQCFNVERCQSWVRQEFSKMLGGNHITGIQFAVRQNATHCFLLLGNDCC